MNTLRPSRVLLVTGRSSAAVAVRQATLRSAAGVDIMHVASRDEFLGHVRDDLPDVIVATTDEIPSLSLENIAEVAADSAPKIPLVVLTESGQERASGHLPAGVADVIAMSHLDMLPSTIEGLLHREDSDLTSEQARRDSRRTAALMRDNQKLIAMGRLTASIVHEINNPLEALTNLLFLLRSEAGLSDNGRNYLAMAEREMGRVVQISKQALNFYRESPSPIRVRPSDLMEEVLTLYRRKLVDKHIEVVRQYRAGEETVSVFPGEIRQVFSNLVTNAIEACSPGGKLTLRVRRARSWSDSGIRGLRIIVADNGSGINEESRRHIGELFFTTKGQAGTGLGLWVTMSIVQRYGGDIQLCSTTRESRHGTVFSIFLPTNMRPQMVKNDGEGQTATPNHDEAGPAASSAVSAGAEIGPSRPRSIRSYRGLDESRRAHG